MELQALRIAPEYGTWPTWNDAWDGTSRLAIDFNALPISDLLKKKIQAWDNLFQATLDNTYPPDSRFLSEEDRHKYLKEGEEIYHCLQDELPNVKVRISRLPFQT